MSTIARICRTYRWEIITHSIVLPSSVVLTCYFKRRWILDAYTTYPGIICATVLNSAVLAINVAIQKKWGSYWIRKNEEANKGSREAAAVQANKEEYDEAALALEQAHAAIRETKLKLETATRDKKLKVDLSKVDSTQRESEMRAALKVRDDFITDKFTPAIKDLEQEELTRLIEEESKIENVKFPEVISDIFSIFAGLKKSLDKAGTDNTISFNIPQIISKLNPLLDKLKQSIFAIEENDRKLLHDTTAAEKEQKELKTVKLPRLKTEQAASTFQMNREAEEKLQLEIELSSITSQMEALQRDINTLKLEEAKIAFQTAAANFKKNELELGSIKLGTPPDPQNLIEEASLTLMTYASLLDLSRKIDTEQKSMSRKVITSKDELKTLAKDLCTELKTERDLIIGNLCAWKEAFDAKREELREKRGKTLNENNQKKAGLLNKLNPLAQNQDDPEVKQAQQRKIETYFNDLSEILDGCSLQYDKTASMSSPVKTSITLEIPDWKESESDRSDAIRKLTELVRNIQKQDLLLPLITQLYEFLNHEDIKYQDSTLTRLLLDFKRNNIYVYLSVQTKNPFTRFKAALEIHSKILIIEKQLNNEYELVNKECEKKKKKTNDLTAAQEGLEKIRKHARQNYKSKNKLYLKYRGEYGALADQKKKYVEKQQAIQTNKSKAEAKKLQDDLNVQAIEKRLEDLSKEIGSNKKKLEANKPKLQILRDVKSKLDVLVTSTIAVASLLNQLDAKQAEYQKALKALKDAQLDVAAKEKELLECTEDLDKEKKARIAIRGAKQNDLQDVETKLAISIGVLNKAEYDADRLKLFLAIIQKCESVQELYKQKKEDPKDTTKKVAEMRDAVQLYTSKVTQARIDLALKRQLMNSQKARLGDLTEPLETFMVAKYKLMLCQRETHLIDQEWRIGPDVKGFNRREKSLGILQDENLILSLFFRSKMRLPSSKKRKEEEHHERCAVQALIAFIDLFADRMYVDLIRHNVRPPKNSNIVERLIELVDKSKNINLFSNYDEEDNPIKWLIDALDNDQKRPRDPADPPTLTAFIDTLERIVKTIPNRAILLERKIPLIKAKLDLINHLTTKPYKENEAYKDDFEKYQKDREVYRTNKYQKKIDVAQLEKEYIEHKDQYVEHNRIQRNAHSFSDRLKYTLIELPFIEKVSYLIPAVLLVAAYQFELINKLSTAIYLEYQAGFVIWAIMTSTQLSIQILFSKTHSVFKKAIPQPATP